MKALAPHLLAALAMLAALVLWSGVFLLWRG